MLWCCKKVLYEGDCFLNPYLEGKGKHDSQNNWLSRGMIFRRSEATQTWISSSRAPNLPESVLRTYLERRRERKVEETLLNPLFSEYIKLQHNGGNRINWRCCLQGWAQTAQGLLFPCPEAARCRAGLVCAVPNPTDTASLGRGWKNHTAPLIYVPRSSCSWYQVAMPGAEGWLRQEREGKLCLQGVLQHSSPCHERNDQAGIDYFILPQGQSSRAVPRHQRPHCQNLI